MIAVPCHRRTTFLAAYAIHAATLVSMGCFFAAVLSFIAFYCSRQERFAATEPGSSPRPWQLQK
jgi:hypothetical protein